MEVWGKWPPPPQKKTGVTRPLADGGVINIRHMIHSFATILLRSWFKSTFYYFSIIMRNYLCFKFLSLCKKIYIGERGSRVKASISANTYETLKEMTTTHPNQWPDISISLNILSNTWRSAAFPHTRVSRKAFKVWNKNSFFQIGTLNYHDINERFSFN